MPRPEALHEDIAAAESLDAAKKATSNPFGNVAAIALAPTMFRKNAGHKPAAPQLTAAVQSSPKVWTFAAWLENEGIAQLIAQALVGDKLADFEDADGGEKTMDEMWAARELVSEHGDHLDKELRRRLVETTRSIGEYLAPKLRGVAEAMEQKMRQDVQEKYAMSEGLLVKQESLSAFHTGLEGKIGVPHVHVPTGVEEEHTLSDDAKAEFGSGHYEITTTSFAEWQFVFEPDKAAKSEWARERTTLPPNAHARVPMRLEEVRHRLKTINQKLTAAGHPLASEAEALCGRLYTGPMYTKYSAAVRGYGNMYADTKGNSYATTIHALNSLITKTSGLTKVTPLYRGVMSGAFPDWFWTTSAHGVHGCVDAAFASASADRAVATDWSPLVAQNAKAPTILEIRQGLRDRGAHLEWISQYPHEHEVVLPPMSGLEVVSTRSEVCMLVIVCNLCVNLKPTTIEEVIGRQQQVVRDACEQYIQRTVHAVETRDEWRVVRELHPDGAARKLVRSALQRTYAEATSRPDGFYSDDDQLCTALQTAARQSANVERWAHAMESLCRYLPDDDISVQRDVTTLLTVPVADFARRSLGRHDAVGLCAMLNLNPNLTSVNLLFNDFDLADAKALAEIARSREKPVSLCGIGYRQHDARFVGDLKLKAADAILLSADLATRPSLTKLVVDENPLGIDGGTVLCDVLATAHNSPLRHLSLANTALGPGGGAVLARVLSNRWTGLQVLSIGFNRLGVEGGVALASALQVNTALTALNLHYNALEDEATVAIVRALQANPKSKLASLTLSSNGISSIGAAVLAGALADGLLPALGVLDLSWNKIGVDGGQALVDALESNTALSLSLSLRTCGMRMEVQSALKAVAKQSTAQRRVVEVSGLSEKA